MNDGANVFIQLCVCLSVCLSVLSFPFLSFFILVIAYSKMAQLILTFNVYDVIRCDTM